MQHFAQGVGSLANPYLCDCSGGWLNQIISSFFMRMPHSLTEKTGHTCQPMYPSLERKRPLLPHNRSFLGIIKERLVMQSLPMARICFKIYDTILIYECS
mgnify:CR=1 FL=1